MRVPDSGTKEDTPCDPWEEWPQEALKNRVARRFPPGESMEEPTMPSEVEGRTLNAAVEGPEPTEEEVLRTRGGKTDSPSPTREATWLYDAKTSPSLSEVVQVTEQTPLLRISRKEGQCHHHISSQRMSSH